MTTFQYSQNRAYDRERANRLAAYRAEFGADLIDVILVSEREYEAGQPSRFHTIFGLRQNDHPMMLGDFARREFGSGRLRRLDRDGKVFYLVFPA